jgi:hypothetical protein
MFAVHQTRLAVSWLSAIGFWLGAAANCFIVSAATAADNNLANRIGPRLILIIRHAEKPDDGFADEDYAALAQKLLTDKKYDQKFILICWHHGHIPDLAFALGASPDGVPNPWDPTVFNLILQLEYKGSGSAVTTKITESF